MQVMSHTGRSWCPHCVKGQAQARVHVKQNSMLHEAPTVSMDYVYFVKPEEDSERGAPSIAITDDKSGMLKSAVLKQKGVDEWSVKVTKDFVQLL